MANIVERLRARIEKWSPNDPEYGRYTVPPPAIQIEAADEIERLRAENERLREALELVPAPCCLGVPDCDGSHYPDASSPNAEVCCIVRAALALLPEKEQDAKKKKIEDT